MRLSPWDYGAGLILLKEVGGTATRVNGEPIDLLKQNSIMAGNPYVHEAIHDHIQHALQNGGFLEDGPLT
jgi:myo-inositol-1(or 4)-monophosphatase